MKKIIYIVLGLLFTMLDSIPTLSQERKNTDTLFVSDRETTYLLFPEEVDLVDIGRVGEYAARIDGKCVFLKAMNAQVAGTNLLVRYGEEYFTAKLLYTSSPEVSLYDFRLQADHPPFEEKVMHKTDSLSKVEASLVSLMDEKGKKIVKKWQRNGMKVKVNHLKNGKETLYVGLELTNKSTIDFEIDFAGFSLQEKRGKWFSKNNQFQKELIPISFKGTSVILAKEKAQLFYALPLYAMTSRGRLHIIFREKNGSRILRIAVPAKKINNASSLSHDHKRSI